MGTYLYRLFGACTLDAGMYETLEADRSVTWQAALTVVLATAAAAVGMSSIDGFPLMALVKASALAFTLWVCWSVLMHQIGTRVFPGRATRASLGELLRTTGFAAAPGLVQLGAIFPGAARVVFPLTWLWMFVAMVVALRHALDYDSHLRAAAVAGSALLVCLGFALLLSASFSRVVY